MSIRSSRPGARREPDPAPSGGGESPRPRRGDLGRAAEILRAIAHPLRLRILSTLSAGEESVTGIATRLGTRPTTVTQALVVLRREGLVAVTRRHRAASYRLEEPSLREIVRVIERNLSDAGPRRSGLDPLRSLALRG